MDHVIAWIVIIILVWNWKGVLKFMGFFFVGFMIGLKGINPLKWFDE